MFIGRKAELQILENDYQRKKSGIVAIYGRRRIGKSELVAHYLENKKAISCEALEKEHTQKQIEHFKNQVAEQLDDRILKNSKLTNWNQIFDYLTEVIAKQEKKIVIFFDEFQWMAAGQTKLVALIKFYWDNKWKQHSIQLILCGSISSYMVSKVIKSKALFGRIDIQMKIEDMPPSEAHKLLGIDLSCNEVLKYLLLFGGIPKYLELPQRDLSFDKNIEQLCFKKNSYFLNEFERIFYSQFKRHRIHEKIVILLSHGPKTLSEIVKSLKMKSSGGITRYLNELQMAGFILHIPPSLLGKKEKKYKLIDEYLRLYFQYIKPNNKLINSSANKSVFRERVRPVWNSWLGLAFENFCLKRIDVISRLLKIDETIINFGPIIIPGKNGVQIDLALETSDKSIYVCECKYHDFIIGLSIIPEFERKLTRALVPKRYSIKKILITANGASLELKNAQYFDKILSIKEIFSLK